MPQDNQGRFVPAPETYDPAAIASAARTSTGTGTAFDTSGVDSIAGTLVVTAVAGTSPTLDLTLETTVDGTNYYTAGTYPQQGATTTGVAREFAPLGNTSRWKWTIGGSAGQSLTFALTATVER